MTKYFISLIAVMFAYTAFAQTQNSLIPDQLAKKSAIDSKEKTGDPIVVLEDVTNPAQHPVHQTVVRGASYTEWIVGGSFYDLQSNSSVMPRIKNSEGDRSVIYTMSNQSANFTDRGTGYNFTNDDFWGDLPINRIEDIRTGWPSLMHMGDGSEVIIAHEFPIQLYMMSRDAIGSGDWTEEYLPTDISSGISWNRAAAGGQDGNSIHMIALTMPVANGGVLYEGMDGALLYSRSPDGGETWDIYEQLLPEIDSTQFLGFSADSYALAAQGDKVVFAAFNTFADSFIMTSLDNGDTWTKTLLVDFPVDLYTGNDEIIDLNEDQLADTVYNTDNGGALHIDSNGITHVAWGNMFYLDDVLGDDQWSYFPYTDGLAYWNETMEEGAFMEIAFTADLDDSGLLELTDEIGLYFMSMTGMPQIAEDAGGDIYVSYSGIVESHSTGSQNYRHLHLLKSSDGGATWTDPVDATPDLDFWGYEAVFPSMAPVVDDYLHILYQRDFEPGLAVRGDLDPTDLNDMMYFRITPDLVVEEVVGMEETEALVFEVFPNPTAGMLFINFNHDASGTLSLMDLSGKIVLNESVTGSAHTIDTGAVEAGVYYLRFTLGDQLLTKKIVVH